MLEAYELLSCLPYEQLLQLTICPNYTSFALVDIDSAMARYDFSSVLFRKDYRPFKTVPKWFKHDKESYLLFVSLLL